MKVRTKSDRRKERMHKIWLQFDKEMHSANLNDMGPFTTAYISVSVFLFLIIITMCAS